jgi:ElaB/YqjD/DUF883 family membrane-anchored ribosome-binding protein
METRPVSKYEPLGDFLGRLEAQHWRPTFHELERLLGTELPASARKRETWWGNDGASGAHAKTWTEAGWKVEKVDLPKQVVSFIKDNGANGMAEAAEEQLARGAELAGKVRRTAQAAKDWAGEVPGRAAQVVRQRPAAALGAGAGVAFAAGVLIGLLLMPRRSPREQAIELAEDHGADLFGLLRGGLSRLHVPDRAVAAAQHRADDALSALRGLLKSAHLPDGAAEAARDRAEDALHALKDGLRDLRSMARDRFGR